MAFYILKGSKYVARSGHHSSYTTDLNLAATFRTREEAQRHVCPENERITERFIYDR